MAAMLIGLAILFDILDGRVARLANATSEFGKEFDSLAEERHFERFMRYLKPYVDGKPQQAKAGEEAGASQTD